MLVALQFSLPSYYKLTQLHPSIHLHPTSPNIPTQKKSQTLNFVLHYFIGLNICMVTILCHVKSWCVMIVLCSNTYYAELCLCCSASEFLVFLSHCRISLGCFMLSWLTSLVGNIFFVAKITCLYLLPKHVFLSMLLF